MSDAGVLYANAKALHKLLQESRAENTKLRELLADCHALLQRICDGQDVYGRDCPMWPDRGDDCDLRKVERSMREMGIGVDA